MVDKITIRGISSAFKHVTLDVAESFASGSVKLGTYSHYRSLEGSRGDPMEGRVSIQQTTPFHIDQADRMNSSERAALLSMGINVGGLGSVSVRGLHVESSLAPHYIFCCSDVPDLILAKREGLAIFQITNIGKFGHEITRARPDLLGAPVVGRVQYRHRSGDPFINGAMFPDAFIKSPSYEREREIRIVWTPLQTGKDYEIVSVPSVKSLLKRLF